MVSKRSMLLVLIIICVLTLILVLVSRKQPPPPEPISRVRQQLDCAFSGLPRVFYLQYGNDFVLQGSPDCNYTLRELKREREGHSILGISPKGYATKHILREGRSLYLQDGLYLHLLSSYPSGARLAFTADGKPLVSGEPQLLECFQSPPCLLECLDFGGVYVDINASCPRGTLPLASTPMAKHFASSSQRCCLNYPKKPLLLPTQSTYYTNDMLKVFYIGPSYSSKCRVYLISPGGQRHSVPQEVCPSYSEVVQLNLKSYIGDEYGEWKVVTELMEPGYEGLRAEASFFYSGAPLIFIPGKIPRGGNLSITLMNTEYSIRHISGCGSGVSLQVGFNNITLNISIAEGEKYRLHDSVTLMIRGAPCSGDSVSFLLQAGFQPLCPNRFCEVGEWEESCPWDCLNNSFNHEAPANNEGECTRGCLFSGKCLEEGFRILINSEWFICRDKRLSRV